MIRAYAPRSFVLLAIACVSALGVLGERLHGQDLPPLPEPDADDDEPCGKDLPPLPEPGKSPPRGKSPPAPRTPENLAPPRDAAPIAEYLKRIEKGAAEATANSLRARAVYLDDPESYAIARVYLDQRLDGASHDRAISRTRARFRRAKFDRRNAGVYLRLDNTARRSGPRTTLFTLEKKRLPDGLVELRGGSRQLRLKTPITPAGFRAGKLRIARFYYAGRRERKPIIGRPFSALVFAEKTAHLHLSFERKQLKDLDALTLDVSGLKVYRGPFRSNILDLNNGSHTELEPIELELALPEDDVAVPDLLRTIVRAVRR